MSEKNFDVFISYSRKDYVDEQKNVIAGNRVSLIMHALQDAGITFWMDEKGIYSGDEFAGVIANAIDASKIFVFVSSEASNCSPWALGEVATAQEAGKKIIPVKIDSSRYHKSLRVRLNALDYIDFTANPNQGCDKLVRAIKVYLAELEAEERRIKEKEIRKEEKQKQEEALVEKIREIERKIENAQRKMSEVEKEREALEQRLVQQQAQVASTNRELERNRLTSNTLESSVAAFNMELNRLQGGDVSKNQEESHSIIGKWNWGAFSLNWIWSIFNGIFWPLGLIPLFFIPYINVISLLAVSVYLGKRGNDISWNSKHKWKGNADFEKTQALWNTAGMISVALWVIVVSFGIIYSIKKH